MVPRWLQVTVLCLCIGGLVLIVRQSRATEASPPPAAANATDPWGVAPFAMVDTDTAIQKYTTRVQEDPRDYLSYTVLGQLHMRKGRESGDLASYQRAEAALRQAIVLNADHAPAKVALAAAYTSQHKFHEAIDLARGLYEKMPARTDLLATLADAYLETGQYKEGESAVQQLVLKAGRTPPVLARLALVAELHGQSGQAVQHMRQAVATLQREGESGHDVAWYETRLGDLYFHNGCLDEAASHFAASLTLVKDHYIGLAGLAEVRAAQGRPAEADALFAQAVAAGSSVGTLFDLGRFHESQGRREAAAEQYKRAEAAARREGVHQAAYYRDLATFYAEQPGREAAALEFAERDLAVRRDVEGLDSFAWALYKNGRIDEAAAASADSMKLGTREPGFYYHAAMIAERQGQRDKARAFLERGFALGAYHFTDEARATLRRLGGVPEGPSSCTLGKSGS